MSGITYIYASTSEIDKAEMLLVEQLRQLDQEYKTRAKPILDKIAQLHEMKTPFVVIAPEQPKCECGGECHRNRQRRR